jgi:hypothetical protein
LKRNSYALACRRFKGSHTYDRIADLILNIFGEYKIPIGKVVKVVTDSGSNFLKAFKEFSVDNQRSATVEVLEVDSAEPDINLCDFLEIGEVLEDEESQVKLLPPHQPCASHKLNLVCSVDITKSRATKLQKSSFAKCQGIWNKVSRSTQASESVKELCSKSLITQVCTRWNSFFDSITSLFSVEDCLPGICKATGTPEFKSTEIEFLKQYTLCVKPIAQGLDRLQGENCTFYGELIPTLLSLQEKLKRTKSHKLTHCESLPQLILDSLRKRFGSYIDLSLQHEDAIIAAVSHPFFKLRWAPKERSEEIKTLFIRAVCSESPAANERDCTVIQESINYNPIVSSVKAATLDLKTPKDDSFFEFGNANEVDTESQGKEQSIKDECEAYLRSPSDEVDILQQFPFVKAIFIKYNTPIPSSAPVERLFNYSKMVLAPNRRRINDCTFE